MISFQTLPSIEQLLQSPQAEDLIAAFGRPLTLDALRFSLNAVRLHGRANPDFRVPNQEAILAQAQERLALWQEPVFHQVINATGVILHTNLGRAPLSKAAIAAMAQVSQGYSNLELDLATGKRGSRLVNAESVLQKLTGAQSAMVVNNNASAVLLSLTALASRKRVIIARSQLVEIGGGFRIPDVMKQSGAKLVELGTTNNVRWSDYEEALQEGRAIVMRVNRSNFKMIGFTKEAGLKE